MVRYMKFYYIMILLGLSFLVTVVADVAQFREAPRVNRKPNAVGKDWSQFQPKVKKILDRNSLKEVSIVPSELK